MSAVPAATAAWLSLGTALAVIWSLWPPLGAWTVPALVILPPLTVMRTWTAPYCVWTASPVTVAAWAAPEPWDEPALACALSRADWRDSL